jgi:hypothetical protein
VLSNIKILITLSYGKGCVWTEEFMGEEDISVMLFGVNLWQQRAP